MRTLFDSAPNLSMRGLQKILIGINLWNNKLTMVFREAQIADIRQIQQVRNSVNENRLSDPRLVTDEDVKIFITERGKGWVCEGGKEIVGFSIVDLKEKNIWALFVKPGYEGWGIGKELHKKMLDWYFSLTRENVWLGTAPNTRAAKFYEMQGWKNIGMSGPKEIKFEMEFATWHKKLQTEHSYY